MPPSLFSAIEPKRLWSFELHRRVKEGSSKAVAPRRVTVELRPLAEDRTEAAVGVATGTREEPELARIAVDRLYDLVQMAATL